MVGCGGALLKYLHNLSKDGTGYIIHFYPINGVAIVDHNFRDSSFAYRKQVAADLITTAHDILVTDAED